MKVGTKGQDTSIVDRNGNKILFGDTMIFADKYEWNKSAYFSKILTGKMTKTEVMEEIQSLPYETRIVDSVQDYEWLLSSEIQTYWEVVPQDEILNIDTPITTLRNKMNPMINYFNIADRKGESDEIDTIINNCYNRCKEVIKDVQFLLRLIPDNAITYDDSIPESDINDEEALRLHKIVHKNE